MVLGPGPMPWPGSVLLERECGEYARTLPDLFGFHLLQVGGLGGVDLSSASRIRHRVVARRGEASAGECQLLCDPEALPITSHSVDVVLLPHSLEYCTDPQQALREVERVLVSGGHVLISGFSPWGVMAGLGWLWPHPAGSPLKARYLAPYRIRDWLLLLGFEVINSGSPSRSSGAPLSWARLRPGALGRRLLLWSSGGYFILGRKSEGGVIPLVGRRARLKGLLPGVIVQPSPRAGSLANPPNVPRSWRESSDLP